MAIEFFIPLREEAVAIDHATGIELGSTSGNLVAQAVQLGFAHPVLVLQQPHAFTYRLTGGLIARGVNAGRQEAGLLRREGHADILSLGHGLAPSGDARTTM